MSSSCLTTTTRVIIAVLQNDPRQNQPKTRGKPKAKPAHRLSVARNVSRSTPTCTYATARSQRQVVAKPVVPSCRMTRQLPPSTWRSVHAVSSQPGPAPNTGGFLLSKRCIKWLFNVNGRPRGTCQPLMKLSAHAGSYRNVKLRHWSTQRNNGGVITKPVLPVCTPQCGNCSARK